MTVRELLSRIESRELTEWAAYERVTGPLGPERADIHAGIIASTIANANRGKGGKKAKPKDFIPKWDRPSAQSASQQLNVVKQLNQRFGGERVKRRREGGD